MRKISVVSALVLAIVSGSAMASNSVSVGYAHSASDGAKLNGAALKYGYQPDAQPWGFVASATLTGGSDSYSEPGAKASADYGYGSLMVGASYEINQYVKPYAQVGVGRAAVDTKVEIFGDKYEEKDTSTALAYGVGVEISPVKNVFIDAGYQGSKAFGSQVNTFNIAAGFRF